MVQIFESKPFFPPCKIFLPSFFDSLYVVFLILNWAFLILLANLPHVDPR